MRPASARLRHVALTLAGATAAYLISPLLPSVTADTGEGLGAGGAAFAFNYTLIVGIVLAFIFGFGLRDYIQKRILRASAKKRSVATPPRT